MLVLYLLVGWLFNCWFVVGLLFVGGCFALLGLFGLY